MGVRLDPKTAQTGSSVGTVEQVSDRKPGVDHDTKVQRFSSELI